MGYNSGSEGLDNGFGVVGAVVAETVVVGKFLLDLDHGLDSHENLRSRCFHNFNFIMISNEIYLFEDCYFNRDLKI